MDSKINDLRHMLEDIFNPYNSDEMVSAKIEGLKKSHPHEITIHQTRSDFEEAHGDNYNCFEFALGLADSSEYKKIRKNLARGYALGIFCNSCFVKWLIDKNKLNSSIFKGMEVIVIYSCFIEIKHAGIIKDSTQEDSLIISKFGVGHIYQHPKDQVLDSYGYITHVYEKPKLADIVIYFKEYLKEIISNIEELIR